MNYRHIFHAGNISDIVKHAALTLVIDYLRGKDKAFCILDTHAGIGLYDLQDERATKTNEAQNGILRLLAAEPIPELAEYFRVLEQSNPNTPFRFYPGSPVIARQMLRPQDRLMLCELHDEDIGALKRQFRNDQQVQIHHRDGYEALRAFLPPNEKRGLVLIDPPYENADEFAHLAKAVIDAHARWPQGIFMIWYPVKDRPAIWHFEEALAQSGMPNLLKAEFIHEEETGHDRLNGCGLIFVNPPWQMDEKLRGLFPALHKSLKTNACGTEVKWLTGGNAETA